VPSFLRHQIPPNDEPSQEAAHYSNDEEYDMELQVDDHAKNEDDDTDSDHNMWLDENNLER